MCMFECLYVCILYIYIYMNDIENKKHKKNYSISVLSPTINNICRKSV